MFKRYISDFYFTILLVRVPPKKISGIMACNNISFGQKCKNKIMGRDTC